jgi:DNA gyrase subunit A
VREFAEDSYFLFTTKQGMVKRSSASLYARCRKSGLIALGLKEDDELIAVRVVTDSDHAVLATAHGMAIRFAMPDVRPMGRSASGVKGIGLRRGDKVVACVTVKDGDSSTMIMTVSAFGYGKRTKIDLYRMQSRGGIGLINFKASPKTGEVIGAMPVADTDSLILLTSTNKIIRLGVDEVRSVGRATMGVRLVRLDDGATVVGFDTVTEGAASDEE